MSVARVANRLGMIRRHIALNEDILFSAPTQNWGYKVCMDVSHDEKVIHFVTEDMTMNDKIEVFHTQRRMMCEMYPEYIITERHL